MKRALSIAGIATALALAAAVAVNVSAAEPTRDFAWTATSVKASPEQPRGYLQYQNSCSVCHGKGTDKPGTLALAAKYGDTKPALLEERTDLDAVSLRHFVRKGVSVMPFFRKTELSDADLEAIIAYLTRPRK